MGDEQAVSPSLIPFDPSRISFADISGELRNKVYACITPINGHMRDFQGLILSCKKVKSELMPAAIKTFASYLKDAEEFEKEKFPHIIIDAPYSWSGMAEVQIRFGVSALMEYARYNGPYCAANRRQNLWKSLDHLIGTHLSRLVIKLYNDGSAAPGTTPSPELLNGSFPAELFRHLAVSSLCDRFNGVEMVVFDLDQYIWRHYPWTSQWYSHWSRSLQHSIARRCDIRGTRLWNTKINGVERGVQYGSGVYHAVDRRVEDTIDQIAERPRLLTNRANDFRVTKITWEKRLRA